MNRKIVASLITIGVVGVLASGSTLALFSDTETSQDNVFTAGAIDLQLGQSNGNGPENDVFFEPGSSQTLFNLGDVKPGDVNETTVAFNTTSNPYYGCVVIENMQDLENSVNEPEAEVDPNNNQITDSPNPDDGELAELSELRVWAELDGDNQFDPNSPDEFLVVDRTGNNAGLPLTQTVWTLADADTNIYQGGPASQVPLQPDTTYYLGVEYSLPEGVGNEAQTDSYQADARFEVTQFRNNEDFQCESLMDQEEEVEQGEDL
jgi:predicted ribosomally synthesized peptide with SipW-like signal peptide